VSALRHPAVHWTLGILLGGVFVYASLDKIANPGEFARIVYHYRLIGPSQMIGPWAANTLAVTLPWVELVLGLALISGFWRREAAVLTGGLLVIFIGAVSAALAMGIDLENCGCFSVSGEGRSAGIKLIFGDLGLLAASGVLAFVEPERPAAPAQEPEVSPESA